MKLPRQPFYKVLFLISLFILTLSFSGTVLASGDHEGSKQEQDAGAYHVTLETQPGSIVDHQKAAITITVANKSNGQAVAGARVISQITMETDESQKSSMQGMDNTGMDKPIELVMQEQSGMNMQPGSYMAQITFEEPGHWQQVINIASPLGQSTVSFPIDVARSGPNYIFLGIVAGLVIISGIAAGVIKKKKIAEQEDYYNVR